MEHPWHPSTVNVVDASRSTERGRPVSRVENGHRRVGVGAFLGVLFISWTDHGAIAAPTSESIARLRAAHQAAEDTFRVLTNPVGEVRLVMGRFDVQATRARPRTLEEGVVRFLHRNRELFGFAASQDITPNLRFTRTSTKSFHGYSVVEGYQVWDGLRLRSSGFVAGFDPEGRLVGLSGTVWAPRSYRQGATSPSAIGSAALRALNFSPTGLPTYTQVSNSQWVSTSSTTARLALERVVEPRSASASWEVETDDWRVLVDESTLVAYAIEPRFASAEFIGHGIVTHRDYDPSDLNTQASIGLSVLELDRAEAPPYPEYCYSFLRMGVADGRERPILPVIDDLASESVLFDPCNTEPHFAATEWSDPFFRQQDVFQWMSVVRRSLEPAWDDTPPAKTAGIQARLNTNDVCPYTSNCFSHSRFDAPTLIYDRDEPPNPWPLAVTMHEFGHYFVWTYGNLGFQCEKGVDESRPLNETIADLAATFGAHYFWEPFIDYQTKYAVLGFPQNFPYDGTRHMNGVAIESLYDDSQCPTTPTGGASFGAFFEHAIWEILFDVDCTAHGALFCGGYRFGEHDIGWSGSTDARESIVKALGFALDFLPENATYNDLGSWMVWYWHEIQDRKDLSLRAASVMEHHGMCVTVGCTN